LRASVARWLVDRAGFRVEPSSVASVTLEGGGKRLVLARARDRLVAADAGSRDPGDRVGEALAALRAEDVVHLGPPKADEGFASPALDVHVRPGADGGAGLRFRVGRTSYLHNEKIDYARLDGVDATFAIAHDRLAPLFDAL
jgi:hypothetical protein